MRSCASVLKAVAVVGVVFVTAAPATACSVITDEEAHGLTSTADGGAAANAPGSGGPGSTNPGSGNNGPGTSDSGTTGPGKSDATTGSPGEAGTNPPPTVHPPGGPGCGLPSAAFCDTFDAPAGIGDRAGDLNGTIWGVSRVLGGVNFGQGEYIATPATTLESCNGSVTVRPPNDIVICNGQLREATNDNPTSQYEAGGVTVLAMYPKQPFDWSGRTGTIVFDVSDDSHGTHAAWPELWITDRPVPAPFTHFGSWISVPQFGLGLRFAGCPLGGPGIGLDSAIVINDWVPNDSTWEGTLQVTGLACLTPSTGPGDMMHFEVKVSQSQIDVYGTDAGTTAPLKHIATVANANIGFTRGLVWLEDVHYNADKGGLPTQRQHTFSWDNFGFDGPFTYRDLAFDAPDNNQPSNNGTVNTGKFSAAGAAATWDVPGIPASPTAEAVRVLFNVFHYDAPTTIDVTVNGHAHPTPWPFPTTQGYTFRTLAVTIPVTDLVAGNNQVTIGAPDQALVSANVDIVLVNVTQ